MMANYIQYLKGGPAYTYWEKKGILVCYACGVSLQFGDRIVHSKGSKGRSSTSKSKLRCYDCAKRLHIV